MTAPPTPREVVRARHDPEFAWHIVARRPLLYREGEASELDRPAHVRAASGITWIGDRLVTIQDDANFLALIDPRSGLAESVSLPAGHGGKRLFGDDRGTKAYKLDLEACVAVGAHGREELIAFGSGSKPLRERIVRAPFQAGRPSAEPRVVDATAFYRLLHEAHAFSGSELNLEGVAVRGEMLHLFQRGNGAPKDGRTPINAVATLPLSDLLSYLQHDGEPAFVPRLSTIRRYELGAIDGVALSFTDATLAPEGKFLFLASAEASADATSDGGVSGTCIGEIEGDDVRLGPLFDEHGAATRLKAEGIALDPLNSKRLYLVVDMDDNAVPSELLEVQFGAR